MTFSIVNSLPEALWSQFVEQHPEGNIFHTPEMFHVFEQTKGYTPAIWAAVGDGDILALFLPVHISLNTGLLRRLTTRSIVFGGLLVNPKCNDHSILADLLKAYQQSVGYGSLFTEIRNVSCCDHFRSSLAQVRFFHEDHLNYLIDLAPPPEEVFKRIGHRTQRNIRHAMNQGKVEIREISSREGVVQSDVLIRKTYGNAKVPLAHRSLFENAFEILHKKGMIQFTSAFVGEVPAATSVELLYKGKVYGWYGGMDREYRAFVPNEVLMWHILRTFCERGFQQYDFGGAGKPNETYGVRDFKAKFGGNLVNYGRNTWIPHKILFQLSRMGYTAYRRVFTGFSQPGKGGKQ